MNTSGNRDEHMMMDDGDDKENDIRLNCETKLEGSKVGTTEGSDPVVSKNTIMPMSFPICRFRSTCQNEKLLTFLSRIDQ